MIYECNRRRAEMDLWFEIAVVVLGFSIWLTLRFLVSAIRAVVVQLREIHRKMM